MKPSTKVLLIGWDAADWNVINPLIEQGKMPHLKSLMDKGAHGTIETLQPPLSPMLWTSIATGKTADKHGVLGFIEADLISGNPRPVCVSSRQCKALWTILSEQEFKTNVIGWWPSHPAENINGVSVSNLFIKNSKEEKSISQSVYPAEWEEKLETEKIYAEDISLLELSRFVPNAFAINQDKDKHLHNLASQLANAKSIQGIAKKIITTTDWDFTAVYFDVIDQLNHSFMKFYPPQMVGIPKEYYELYHRVVDEMYCYHDMLLGELLDCIDENTTVMVLSDHGFYSNHLRPVRLPNDPASPALEHAPFGMLCLKGGNIKTNQLIKGASLLDITPTILQLFNLPIAHDMDGKALHELLIDDKTITMIDTYELAEGLNDAAIIENKTSWQSTTALFQLMELGYVQRFDTNKEETLKKIINESHYYLASVYLSIGKHQEACDLLHPIYLEHKTVLRYAFKYAGCLQGLNKQEEAYEVMTELYTKHTKELPPLEIIKAIYLSNIEQREKALDLLLLVEKQIKHLPELYVMIGNTYAQLQQWKLAEASYKKALALQPQHTQALINVIETLAQQQKETISYKLSLENTSKKHLVNFTNSYALLHDLDFNIDRTIDFRKYQLIIRLFLEQFHKGVKQLK